MTERDYDLIVIGSGPAGEKGAAQAAYFGRRVALVERQPHVGGAAVNTGTLPSKTLRETALYFSGLRQRGLFGIDYSLREGLRVSDFLHREQAVVDTERRQILRNLRHHRIELVPGDGSLVDAHTVAVRGPDGERRITADVILIATGSTPVHPDGVPFDSDRVFDSDSILTMGRIPRSLVVVGGGVIGAEYASIFTALGIDVTLVDSRDRLLPFLDAEIADRLRDHLAGLGLGFRLGRAVADFGVTADGIRVRLDSGEELAADAALFASGRASAVDGLGLERVGVAVGRRGVIAVNEHFQTSVPSIYAAGDVIGFPALASTSMEQARVAMAHAWDLGYKNRVSAVVPLAVYTVPEIGMAGMSEEVCVTEGIPHLVGRASFADNARGQIIGDDVGLVKLVFAAEDKRLLGVHVIGEQASELVHIGAAALSAGATIDGFIDAVYNYPTLSEAFKYAAYDGLQHWAPRR